MERIAGLGYPLYERILKRQIRRQGAIGHVAVIQDGNRRYARERGIASQMGHSMGAKTTDLVADWCLELGIKHLTVYTLSTENLKRSPEELECLFDLIRRKLLELSVSQRVHRNQVRVRAIGRTELLQQDLKDAVRIVEEATSGYSSFYFNIALAYGGQYELVDAARILARSVKAGSLRAEDVDEETISQHLYPDDGVAVPKVDLIIRTGGEVRTSNFLPWQANGNECAAYFCAPYWPEFRMIDFLRAVRTAQSRKIQTSNQQA